MVITYAILMENMSLLTISREIGKEPNNLFGTQMCVIMRLGVGGYDATNFWDWGCGESVKYICEVCKVYFLA
jgi:hypothetical protein